MPVLTEEMRNRIRAEFPKYPDKRAVTLPALHIVHDALRAVSPAAIVEIAELLELHPSEVSDTMSFYGFFQRGRASAGQAARVGLPQHFVHAARRRGTAGRVCRERLDVKPGQTTADGKRDAGVCRVPGRVRRGAVHSGERRVSHEFDAKSRRRS